ncbi:glycoside hydrolase family 73 protein [Paenibacillus anseongense]|uniref:glycoside hydrolase family 73 protein n=1 Tax=Paenibacillus anseongense TaxID=2682845 RepID=UPI002DBFD47D|nr:glycoside hydrolase family 73 protein [Paenibacillus anseongense]MEC0269044.1 glycoside hydrolase family 73 protein [Paenibacillus anseongense]
MSQQTFIDSISESAIEDMINTGVLASVTIAQACLESAWGKSAIGNNLFGIKGSGTVQATDEFINGEWITIQAGFRVYQSWLASISDHSLFLLTNPWYRSAGFFMHCVSRNYEGAAWALQSAGYATDPNYATKLTNLINSYALYKYDQEADEMLETIKALQAQVLDLQGTCQTLLKTADAHIDKINTLETQNSMPVPDWAKDAVLSAQSCGLVDTPEGRSHDFYSLIVILHRKGLI